MKLHGNILPLFQPRSSSHWDETPDPSVVRLSEDRNRAAARAKRKIAGTSVAKF